MEIGRIIVEDEYLNFLADGFELLLVTNNLF